MRGTREKESIRVAVPARDGSGVESMMTLIRYGFPCSRQNDPGDALAILSATVKVTVFSSCVVASRHGPVGSGGPVSRSTMTRACSGFGPLLCGSYLTNRSYSNVVGTSVMSNSRVDLSKTRANPVPVQLLSFPANGSRSMTLVSGDPFVFSPSYRRKSINGAK